MDCALKRFLFYLLLCAMVQLQASDINVGLSLLVPLKCDSLQVFFQLPQGPVQLGFIIDAFLEEFFSKTAARVFLLTPIIMFTCSLALKSFLFIPSSPSPLFAFSSLLPFHHSLHHSQGLQALIHQISINSPFQYFTQKGTYYAHFRVSFFSIFG